MPQVPTLSRDVLPSGAPLPQQAIQATPAAFGGVAAQAMAAASQGVGQSSARMGTEAQQLQAQTNATLATDAETAYMTALGGVYADFRQKSGRDAWDARTDAVARVAALRKDYEGQLSSDDARRAFDQLAGRHEAQVIQSISLHAGEQNKAWQVQSATASIDADVNMAAQFAHDDQRFGEAVGTIKYHVARMAQLEGWPVEQQANRVRQEIDKAWSTRIMRVAQTDPAAAQALFDRAAGGNNPQIGGLMQERLAQGLKPLVDAQATHADAATILAGVSSAGPDQGGDRANNLGNIRQGPDGFRGYGSPEDGAADAARLLRRGYRGMTVAQIGAKWAPAGDGNDPSRWAATVASAAGMAPGDKPNLDDPAALQRLLSGIATAEQSATNRARFTPAVIGAGVDAALGGSPSERQATADGMPAPAAAPGSAAASIRANYSALMAQVDAQAQARRPGDPVYLEHARAAFRSQAAEILHAQDMVNQTNRAALMSAALGGAGGRPPTTRQELFASSPAAAAAYVEWSAAEPRAAQQLDHMLEVNAKGAQDVPATPENQKEWARLHGLAATDPQAFLGTNLEERFGTMPLHQWQGLVQLRDGMNRREATQEDRTQLLNNAMSNAGVKQIFGSSHLFPPKKDAKPSDDWLEATGRLSSALQVWRQDNPGKSLPGDDVLAKMAADIVQTVRLPQTFWRGDRDVPLYRINAAGAEQVPLDKMTYAIPDDFRKGAGAAFSRRYGRPPTPDELKALYHDDLVSRGVAR